MTTQLSQQPEQDPDRLAWHYADGYALKSIIERGVLWASSAAFMNDSNELLTGPTALKAYFEARRSTFRAEDSASIDRLIAMYESARMERYILCASEGGDLLTLWRNYGRADVSYAVGLRPDVDLQPRAINSSHSHPHPPPGYFPEPEVETDEDGRHYLVGEDPDYEFFEGGPWTRVIYDKEDQASVVKETFEELVRAATSQSPWWHLWASPAFTKLFSLKDHGFQDERELRILLQFVNPSWKYVQHRVGRFGLIPYVELGLPKVDSDSQLQEVELLPIQEIKIGPTAYPEEAARSLKQYLGIHGYHHVSVTSSEIPYR